MLNILNGLYATSAYGWINYDKSWHDKKKHQYVYQLNCSIKPIYKHIGSEFERINLSDKYLIKRIRLITTSDGKLHQVYLGKYQHPHKDPRNNLFCLGKLEGISISHSLVSLLMACLLKYDPNDCFHRPDYKDLQNFEEETEGY